MNENDKFTEYEAANDEERRALELSWAEGRLQRHIELILAFLDRQREDILRLSGGSPEPPELLRTTKRMIIQMGTVHPQAEMQDQIRAIHDEIWIRGEKGDFNRERITEDWTSQHACAWRRWRIKEYLFVADRCVTPIAGRLLGGKL
jgi:hypothetical protein